MGSSFSSEWRTIPWGVNKIIRKFLMECKPSNRRANHFHFLLYGPVGGGKSSIINSFYTTFRGSTCVAAIAGNAFGPCVSQTTIYKTHHIRHGGRVLPFAFSDSMGVDSRETGVTTDDIISAIKGELIEGYMFNGPSEERRAHPSLDDKVHCLINVIAANTISQMPRSKGIIKKMNDVREAASELGIPQVVFMTHIDEILVKKDLNCVYKSKEIKEKMEECSNKLGIPMNCIFPIMNYTTGGNVDDETDCVLLDALRNIVDFANDYLDEIATEDN